MAREWNDTSSTTGLLPRVRESEPATPLSLPTPIEIYDLNLSAVILSIWLFRTLTSIFCTKELYCMTILVCLHSFWPVRSPHLHPKTLFEMPTALSTNSGSFPSNSHVSATFSFWIHSGKIWNLGISNKLWYIQCWRKGRILINLCGKTDVRNCDLLQRDFFCSVKDSPMGGKGFFLECVVKLGKKWGPETLWFYSH